jgi:transcriptional regulator GlxA family with amidase domain
MSQILSEYVSAAELAQHLSLSEATLERWRRRHIGPAPTFVGKKPMYRISTAHEWLKAQERTPNPPSSKFERVHATGRNSRSAP